MMSKLPPCDDSLFSSCMCTESELLCWVCPVLPVCYMLGTHALPMGHVHGTNIRGKNLELQALSGRRRLIRRGSNGGQHAFSLFCEFEIFGNRTGKTSDPGCAWDMSCSTELIGPSLNE